MKSRICNVNINQVPPGLLKFSLFSRSAIFLSLLVVAMNASAHPEPVFNQERACWQTMLPSEFQSAPTRVEVLLPDQILPQKQYPVLYILPVEGPGHPQFGDGMLEAKKADLANKYGLICVYPSFTAAPWFGNHATNPKIRQEDFMLKTLVPWIEANYPARSGKEARWLIGFSKSGWGAFTLLLRNPDVFGYAAAWDVPFMLDGDNSGKDWGPMAMSNIFGSKETMQQFLPTRLAVEKAPLLKERCRLVLGVGAFWKAQSEQMHSLLEKNAIPHAYRPDLVLPHRWDSGWFSPMAEELEKIAGKHGN